MSVCVVHQHFVLGASASCVMRVRRARACMRVCVGVREWLSSVFCASCVVRVRAHACVLCVCVRDACAHECV